MGAVDIKKVKLLKFVAQKNIGDKRVKCLYENDLARIFRRCGILPHFGQERQDAASTKGIDE
jgi:hypothetical protein